VCCPTALQYIFTVSSCTVTQNPGTSSALSKLQFRQYVSYRNRLGNSIHSTGPTEAVLLQRPRHQFVSATASQYWFYRDSPRQQQASEYLYVRRSSTSPFAGPSKRPKSLLTGSFTASQYLSKQGQYPSELSSSNKPFKGPITVSKHGS
jgi:hypothetical protein